MTNRNIVLSSSYSPTKYFIEFNSTFRNRNLFPNPGQFQVTVTNLSSVSNASMIDDPVCKSYPDFAWTSNCFNAVTKNAVLTGTISYYNAGGGIANISDPNYFLFKSNDANAIQKESNYYSGTVLNLDATNYTRRILTSKYIGNNLMILSFGNTFTDSEIVDGTACSIIDPTDLTDLSYPLFFVPCSTPIENIFVGNYLYNESRNEYRVITYFDEISHLIILNNNTSTFTPVTSWTAQDNYCIRSSFPSLISQTVLSTNPSRILLLNGPEFLNIFDGDFLRIRAAEYGNNVVAPETESRRIIKYDPITSIVNVDPPFSQNTTPTNVLEVLPFSYENSSSFIFGSGNELNVQMQYYEVELSSLVLPNIPLKSTNGGKIFQFPFLYVELRNISFVGSGNKNLIYSNNQFVPAATFRVSVPNISDPGRVKFIMMKGDNNPQTLYFKPNDALELNIKLPDGQLFEPIQQEYFMPSSPNADIQISALFSLKKKVPIA